MNDTKATMDKMTLINAQMENRDAKQLYLEDWHKRFKITWQDKNSEVLIELE